LLTQLIVREDAHTLYGFMRRADRALFRELLKVSGVGPKLAMAILSGVNSDDFSMMVEAGDAQALTRLPGIGKKTAQKILFELKDKIAVGLDAMPTDSLGDDTNSDVIDTLVALGYSIVEAQTAIQSLPPDAPNDVEERVRMALQYFV